MNNTKAYIFDLDGTLTLTQPLHYAAFSAIFKKYNISYTENEDKYEFAGRGSKEIFPAVFAKHGVKITPEEIAKYAAEKRIIYDSILEKAEIKEVAGAGAFLKKVMKAGIKLIVATGNKEPEAREILTKAGLSDFFTQIVSQKDVENQKPAPDIFLFAASKIGCKPEECIVFEDAINGVKAARAANMYCIALTTGTEKSALAAVGANVVVSSYEELKGKLPAVSPFRGFKSSS